MHTVILLFKEILDLRSKSFFFYVYMFFMEERICKRCGNSNPEYFYKGGKGWYCRKCISFGRAMLEEECTKEALSVPQHVENYHLKYPLTPKQLDITVRCIEEIQKKDVLVHAVCGAGKTEIMVGVIGWFLKRHKKVCFAIARRQVVLEVAERLQHYFSEAKVIAVCGGHTDVLDGDLIVATCHQLFRYTGQFDLLILDEPDAFPFRGNEVLFGIAMGACRGHVIYLTATPDAYLQKRCKDGSLVHLTLYERPHAKPIPVPRIYVGPTLLLLLKLIKWLDIHSKHPRMVFVPSIRLAESLYRLLLKRGGCYRVTSKQEDRDEIVEKFRKEKHGIIIATTVLERGVTVPHADVCVYQADSHSFDEAGLVQMAGRAGRAFDDPYGDVLFLCREKSSMCNRCRKQLLEANDTL